MGCFAVSSLGGGTNLGVVVVIAARALVSELAAAAGWRVLRYWSKARTWRRSSAGTMGGRRPRKARNNCSKWIAGAARDVYFKFLLKIGKLKALHAAPFIMVPFHGSRWSQSTREELHRCPRRALLFLRPAARCLRRGR